MSINYHIISHFDPIWPSGSWQSNILCLSFGRLYPDFNNIQYLEAFQRSLQLAQTHHCQLGLIKFFKFQILTMVGLIKIFRNDYKYPCILKICVILMKKNDPNFVKHRSNRMQIQNIHTSIPSNLSGNLPTINYSILQNVRSPMHIYIIINVAHACIYS